MFAEHDMEVEEMAEVAMFIYRATPNVTTKFTPFMLNTGREARLPMDIIDESRIETLQSEYADLYFLGFHSCSDCAFDMNASRKLPTTTCATLRGKFPKAKLKF
jgi:hypothetical protein